MKSKARDTKVIVFRRIVIALAATCLIIGCCSIPKKSRQNTGNTFNIPIPGVYIYKTRGDYSMLVPIVLSDDKKTIDSYPDIKDVITNGKLAIPTMLNDGFLLDNRGISKNVAFLKLTYQQYAALPSTPNPDSLFNLILDDDPLTILYDCGMRNKDQNLIDEINILIVKKDFSGFKKLK